MDESPQWMRDLGDAFLAQQPHVMDTIQGLRQRAQASGYLGSTAEQRVYEEGPAILVQPAHPQVVYVRYYDPLIVYGPWWWPAYRPVHWRPWPAHRVVFTTTHYVHSFPSRHRPIQRHRAHEVAPVAPHIAPAPIAIRPAAAPIRPHPVIRSPAAPITHRPAAVRERIDRRNGPPSAAPHTAPAPITIRPAAAPTRPHPVIQSPAAPITHPPAAVRERIDRRNGPPSAAAQMQHQQFIQRSVSRPQVQRGEARMPAPHGFSPRRDAREGDRHREAQPHRNARRG
jgi:hypothetical protein